MRLSFQQNQISREKARPSPAQGRINHYEYRSEAQRSRIHLRFEQDGSGTLLVNASQVFYLNPTAALMARLILAGTEQPQAIATVVDRYRVSTDRAKEDYVALQRQLAELVRPEGACPICDLQLEVRPPFSARPSAPYRMDLALTYGCNNDCAHCYNARPRDFPEQDTPFWRRILDRLWEIGIPHVVFTGGEPTLRRDLPELIAYAESLGQITGLNTNGRRLHDPRYLAQLVEAGLDHVQITVESHDARIHDRLVGVSGAWEQTLEGLQRALTTRLYVMTNTTLMRENSPGLGETLDSLARLGVPTVGLNALIYSGRGAQVSTGLPESDLPPLLDLARERTDRSGQRLIWYTPTQYCHFDPMQLELGVKGCTAALYSMCVEPDGSVLPCQSYYQPIGHLLEQDWPEIWDHPLARRLREHLDLPEPCRECALKAECGGGCPLARQAGQQSAPFRYLPWAIPPASPPALRSIP
ncbi:MAG: PqqD family peptide modification chaperone [Anaerolineales bacterium]